jgi:hypothetical protein
MPYVSFTLLTHNQDRSRVSDPKHMDQEKILSVVAETRSAEPRVTKTSLDH